MSPRTRHLRSRGLALLLAAALAAPSLAGAQADPRFTHVAFVHGFRANSDTWLQASSRLSTEFAIVPVVPTMGWERLWSLQANTLRDALPAGVPRIVSVGHSNGGQISRVYNRAFQSTNTALNDRAVFVTSLHKGAPLADNALNGTIYVEADVKLNTILTTVNETLTWEVPPIWGMVGPVAYYFIEFFHSVNMFLARLGFFEEAFAAVKAPSTFDMAPSYSPYYRSDSPFRLNTPENLAREHLSMWSKVAIRGHYHDVGDPHGRPGGILFATAMPESYQEAKVYRFLLYIGALALADRYYEIDHPDPSVELELQRLSMRWASVAGIIADLDVWWLKNIGALGTFDVNQMAYNYQDSDGILPDDTQQYPGLAVPFINFKVHTAQTGSSEVEAVLRSSFATLFNIPRRSELVGSVALTPQSVGVSVGGEVKLTPIVSSLTGSTLQRAVTFTSSNTGVATVSPGGWVTGLATGTTTITAQTEGFQGTATVSVTGAPPPSFNSIAVNGYDWVLSSCSGGEWGISRDNYNAPGPYTYQWTVDGYQVGGDEPWLWYEFGHHSGGFTIGLTATQVNTGVTHTASKYVTIRAAYPNEVCEM